MNGKKPGSPFLALFLSFLIPGLGQFYAGDNGKGVMFMIFNVIIIALGSTIVGLIFSIPMYFIVWIWSMIAAYNACKPQP